MTTAPEPDGVVWHTSSYSSNGGDCVAVASTPHAVLVRDSKNRTGPALTVTSETWQAFLTTLNS